MDNEEDKIMLSGKRKKPKAYLKEVLIKKKSEQKQKGEKTMENQFKVNAKVLDAYEKANDYGKEILEGIFGKEAFTTNIKDKIKTFIDAVEMLGSNNQTVKDYISLDSRKCTKDIIAFARLKIITEALNEGWKPKYDIMQGGYYTSFDIISEYEYERLNENEKKESMVFNRPDNKVIIALVSSKLSVSCESYKLSLKSRELAEYCGKQFMHIWIDYIFG